MILSFTLGFLYSLIYCLSLQSSIAHHLFGQSAKTPFFLVLAGFVRVWIVTPLFIFVCYKLQCSPPFCLAGIVTGALAYYFGVLREFKSF